MTHTTVFELLKNSGIISGSIVISTAGHDRNRIYLVLTVVNKIAYVCDGVYRTYGNPKMKRVSHLKQIGLINDILIKSGQLTKADETGLKDKIIRECVIEFINEYKQAGKEKL